MMIQILICAAIIFFGGMLCGWMMYEFYSFRRKLREMEKREAREQPPRKITDDNDWMRMTAGDAE